MRDARELYDIARDENDDATLASVEGDAEALEGAVEGLEFRRMFSHPADPNNCFLDIQAGAGGTEAQDWAHMLDAHVPALLRAQGLQAPRCSRSPPGEVAGIKSATIKVTGDYAYGHLRTETGVHRLVRKSPVRLPIARRHTSFASVFVYPEVDESIEIEINPADLRVDTYRASRRRRPARQQDRLRRAPHAPAHRHRGAVPERPLASTATAPKRWRC